MERSACGSGLHATTPPLRRDSSVEGSGGGTAAGATLLATIFNILNIFVGLGLLTMPYGEVCPILGCVPRELFLSGVHHPACGWSASPPVLPGTRGAACPETCPASAAAALQRA